MSGPPVGADGLSRGKSLSQLTVQKVVEEIDSVHRELARLSVDQLRGTPSALNTLDIIESHPVPLRPKTISFLRKALRACGRHRNSPADRPNTVRVHGPCR